MTFWKVTGTFESFKVSEDGQQASGGMFRIPEFFVEVEQGHLFGVDSAREKAFAVLTAQGINGTVQFFVHEPDTGRPWGAFIRLLADDVVQMLTRPTPQSWLTAREAV